MLVLFVSALLFLSDILLKSRKLTQFVLNKLRLTTEKEAMSKFLAQGGNITSNTITFFRGDENQCYEITGHNISVFGSTGYHDHGSSKVKLKSIVDYKWETKNYPGHLIAVHMDGKCIAYVIKVNNKLSGTEGMVRVISSGKRALIKGMTGEVLDLQFAHIEKQHILACIEVNVLHIHKIDMLSDTLICNLLLEIEDPILNYSPKYDKVSWCPYVPDETSDGDDDIIQLLVWARGNCFQCLNVNAVISSCGVGKHFTGDITDGHLKLTDTSMVITWVALSPDGTTLSVGSEDGYIRFYQVYFHEKEPRCLHQWNPHNGKPVSSFFFLDNLTQTSTDAYWKHALTGADRNSEFKIWDCGTWNCLQTLSIKSTDFKNSSFIADIDRTSSYLMISNIETRGLYVVQLVNDMGDIPKEKINDSNMDTSPSEKIENGSNKRASVFMKSISEFPLSSPILSFSIVDATIRKYKCQDNESFLMDDLDDYDEENNAAYCVVVRMFIVQPKSVQECHILYQPTVSDSAEVRSTLSNDSIENYKDSLIDITIPSNPSDESNSEEMHKIFGIIKSPPIQKQKSNEKINKISNSPRSSIGHKSMSQVNLMTPDAFSTAGKNTTECVSSEVLSTILMLASRTRSTATSNKTAENLNLLNLVNNKMIEDQEHQKYKQTINSHKNYASSDIISGRVNADMMASGGSSPSREVQEILSLNEYHMPKNYYTDKSKSTDNLVNTNLQKTEMVKDQEAHKKSEHSLEPSSIQSSTNVGDWPKVPDVRNVMKHSAQLKNSSNIITSENIDASELNAKMSQLINMVKLQSGHIADLKTEIEDLKKNSNDSFGGVKDMVYKTEVQVSKLLEDYLVRYDKEHKHCLENFIAVRNTQNQELLDNIAHVLNQILFNQFTEKLSNIIMLEIQKQILPLVVAKLDGIKQQFQTDVAQKLSVTDNILKENIAQVCKSKAIVDTFGNSVLMGVQNGLKATYVQSMADTLIPAYEKSSQEMFKQLHDTFSSGIKEVMEQFDSYVCQMQPVQDGNDEILEKISDLRKYIDVILIKQRTNGSEIAVEAKKDFKFMESNVIKALSDIIQKEVRKNFESQAASLEDSVLSVVRSQVHTPAPSVYDVQDQIKNLLSQGQINKAFHQALIANDLALVEYTLERADYKSVFNPCALEQTVLLSLIQQISADMENHNDIKQRYLSDGILNLDQLDPITKEHAPRVMRELYRNCQNYLATTPKSPLCSNIRMIMMAVQGMGYKVL